MDDANLATLFSSEQDVKLNIYAKRPADASPFVSLSLSLSLSLSDSLAKLLDWQVPHLAIKTPERSDWIPNMTGSNLFDQIKHVVNIYVRPGSLHPASCIQYCKQQAMCQPLDIFEIFLQNKSRKKKTLCPEAGAALLTRDNYYDWSVQSDGAAWCINISRVPSPV